MLANGNLAVATLNTGYVTEISPGGEIVRAVKMPDIYPTNICFGGADMCTAFITLSDTGRLRDHAVALGRVKAELRLKRAFGARREPLTER